MKKSPEIFEGIDIKKFQDVKTCVGGWKCIHCGPHGQEKKIIKRATRRILKYKLRQISRFY